MKTSLRLLLLPLLVIALSSCGLPTVTFLYPPQNFFFSGSATISVQNDSRNYESAEGANQTFKGIEIFYRIYQDSTLASSILSSLKGLSESYDGNPDRFMELVTGTSYKFVRLRNANDRIQPLIAINAADESMYSIELNGNSDWILTNTSTKIIRTISTTSNEVFFSRDFKTGDDDYNGTTASSGSTYYIVFFAVSYGQDQITVGQNVYSMPAIPSSYATY